MGIDSPRLTGVFQTLFISALCSQFCLSSQVFAHLKPEQVYTVSDKKSNIYIQNGLITGGDGKIKEVIVKDIRWAQKSGFERVVMDFEGLQNGESLAIPRLPFFQLSVTPELKRFSFQLSGHPKFQFTPQKIMSAFSKNSHSSRHHAHGGHGSSKTVIENLRLFPPIDGMPWTIVFDLKSSNVSVEVFQLSDPVRLILDIRQKKD